MVMEFGQVDLYTTGSDEGAEPVGRTFFLPVYIPAFIFGPGALGGDQRMRSGIYVVEVYLLEVLFLPVKKDPTWIRMLPVGLPLEVFRAVSKLEETLGLTVNTPEALHILDGLVSPQASP